MKKIGFIGVGIMGKSMVRNLMKNGFEVSIYTRTKSKVLDVINDGAIWSDTIKDCVSNKDVVITIVGYPQDVEEVYFGSQGIIASAAKGTYIIDMTTTSPKLSKKIYEQAKQKGIFALDAPVTGGDVGAKNGTLAILVGGDREAFEACNDVFRAMGNNIVYQGQAGNGQHAKMANQIMIAGAVSGVCEAMIYAEKVGLNLETMLNAVSTGAAGSNQLKNLSPRILEGDFDPGFYIKHFIKDMTIATDEAMAISLDLEVLNTVLNMYKRLAEQGKGDLGTQALIQYYQLDC